jgi:hypothetical protein
MTVPSPMLQYLPIDITTCCPAVDLRKSPRSMAPFLVIRPVTGCTSADVPLCMIDFPPRMMLVAPVITALRDTLSGSSSGWRKIGSGVAHFQYRSLMDSQSVSVGGAWDQGDARQYMYPSRRWL